MNHGLKVGEIVTVRNKTAVFQAGEKVEVVSIEEYPHGRGENINRGHIAAKKIESRGGGAWWVEMDNLEVVVSQEDVDEAIRSITGAP